MFNDEIQSDQYGLDSNSESIVYDLTPNKRNISGNVSHLRDVYLGAEKDYVQVLLQNEDIRKLIYEMNGSDSDLLFEVAEKLVNAVENGEIPEDRMERVEQELIVLLAAIQDKVLLKERVLSIDSEENQKGR